MAVTNETNTEAYERGFDVASAWKDIAAEKAEARIAELEAALADCRDVMLQGLPVIDAYRRIALGDGDIAAANIRAVLERTAALTGAQHG